MGGIESLFGGMEPRTKVITLEQLNDVKVRCFQVTRALRGGLPEGYKPSPAAQRAALIIEEEEWGPLRPAVTRLAEAILGERVPLKVPSFPPFSMVVCTRNCNEHCYGDQPALRNHLDHAIRINGTEGNHLPLYEPGAVRFATDEEINQYFTVLETLIKAGQRVDVDFPVIE